MSNKILRLRRYLYYLLFAHDEYHIHSPFVYDLYTNTIIKEDPDPSFKAIENLRIGLLRNSQTIKVCDYGIGFTNSANNRYRKIRRIARYSLKPKKYGSLLYRIIKHLKPDIALDLGTSLGITTLYQSFALNQNASMFTFEGCPETLKIAEENFLRMHKKIKTIPGNLDETLPVLISKIPKVDFVFFDANHKFSATLNYFDLCLEKAHEKSIFIVDDIHHSIEMDKAWSFIKSHKDVTLTIDLFHLGIVFFRRNQPKQHFMLKF